MHKNVVSDSFPSVRFTSHDPSFCVYTEYSFPRFPSVGRSKKSCTVSTVCMYKQSDRIYILS